jgi:PiT family inorganic phosphate transporter
MDLHALTFGLIAILVLSVAFDYVNGFHDTANAIATSVSTRALTPLAAIAISAAMNFLGAFVGTAVAATIGQGIVQNPEGPEGQVIIAAALIGAIAWNLLTWRLGIPSSSSHALIGGLMGATIAGVGLSAVIWPGFVNKVLIPLITSPLLGFLLAYALMVLIYNLFRRANPGTLNGRFRRLQVVSASFMAFSHGSNDAQKTMGIMTLALVTAGVIPTFEVPTWVIVLAASAMAAGTAAGGWRIIRTMGQRVVALDPVHGFAAETMAASIILGASHFGAPVSTTQVISSAILGAGSVESIKRVRWGVAREMGVAWFLTIPAAGLVAAVAWFALTAVNKLLGAGPTG